MIPEVVYDRPTRVRNNFVFVVAEEPKGVSAEFPEVGQETEMKLVPPDCKKVKIPSEAKLADIEDGIQPWKLRDLSEVCDSSDADALRLYIAEVHRQPLLTAEQELVLSVRIEQGASAREKMTVGWQEVSQRGFTARQSLITHNVGLVFGIARKYLGRGLDYTDLVGYGNIGLIRGAGKYNFRSGCRFSTYVTRWIHADIGEAVANYANDVRYPVHMTRDRRNLLRKIDYLTQVKGKTLSVDEISEDVGTEPKHVQQLIESGQVSFFLDDPLPDKKDNIANGRKTADSLVDLLEDHSEENPRDYLEKAVLTSVLTEALARLTPAEENILLLRTGLLDGHAYSESEVGDKLLIPHRQARYHTEKAMKNLRIIVQSNPKYMELSEYLVQ